MLVFAHNLKDVVINKNQLNIIKNYSGSKIISYKFEKLIHNLVSLLPGNSASII